MHALASLCPHLRWRLHRRLACACLLQEPLDGHLWVQSSASPSITFRLVDDWVSTSSRRGGMGRSSMAPTAAMTSMSQPIKDNRPIRDKQFQILEQKQILKFLTDGQFPGTITMKTLQSPTSKDFQSVFRWLFEILDPCYVLCKGNKKFDDEIIPTLKYHRYPAADQINIKWMQAVGSMHAWPSMLAVLHWMTLLCLVRGPGISTHTVIGNLYIL